MSVGSITRNQGQDETGRDRHQERILGHLCRIAQALSGCSPPIQCRGFEEVMCVMDNTLQPPGVAWLYSTHLSTQATAVPPFLSGPTFCRPSFPGQTLGPHLVSLLWVQALDTDREEDQEGALRPCKFSAYSEELTWLESTWLGNNWRARVLPSVLTRSCTCLVR